LPKHIPVAPLSKWIIIFQIGSVSKPRTLAGMLEAYILAGFA